MVFVGLTVIKDGVEFHVLNERDPQNKRLRTIEFAALAADLSRLVPNMYTVMIDQGSREIFNEDKHGHILCPTPIEFDELITCRGPLDPSENDPMKIYEYRSNQCCHPNYIILSFNQPETEIVRNIIEPESILIKLIVEKIRKSHQDNDIIEIPRLFEDL